MSDSVWLVHVVPSFGNLLASLMLISPVPAVMRLRVTGKLGDLNPFPLPLTAYNAMGWLTYGFATSNPYLFPSNFIGFVAGVFFTMTGHAVATRQVQDRILGIALLGSVHFLVLGMVALFGLGHDQAERMWGVNAIIILMVYYLVPLSTMVEIVQKKNAVSIYPPLAIAAIANGGLWTVYGFALKDVNLWLPNLFGAVIGVVQLLLRLVYGAVSEPPAGIPGSPTGGTVGGGAAGKGSPPKEAPREHPAAKHPAAKDGRRNSLLMMLNPYHYLSHHDDPDVERAGVTASSGSSSNGSLAATSVQQAAVSASSLTAAAKPTATTATPTASGKGAAKPNQA